MKYLIILLSAILLVALTACNDNSDQTTVSANVPLKIGVAVPLTGAWSVGGESLNKGITIAVEELNAAGGLNGRPIESIVEDTQSSVPNAVTAVQKLINVDKVPIIIAGALSAEAMGVAPVAQQAQVVMLSPLALTTPLEKAGEWVFKLRESSRVHAENTIKAMARRGVKKLAILTQVYEACNDLLEHMQKYYGMYEITVITTEKYEGKDTDMRTQLTKLKQADPDALFECGLYQDSGLVFKQAKELGFTKPMYGMIGMESKKLFEIAGDASEGVIYTGTKFSCTDAPSFCTAFKQKYNAEPDYRSAFGYDSVKLIVEAVKRSGQSSKEIQQGLLSIQNWKGAGGTTSFDSEGNARKEVVLKQVKGNKFVTITE